MKKTVACAEVSDIANDGDTDCAIGPSDGPLAGSVLYEGDIVSPIGVEWNAAKWTSGDDTD